MKSTETREELVRDAKRYRIIREAGSQLKLWMDDDWYYKPSPELVDEWCDTRMEGKP